jgi:hypothetical protein
VKICQFLGKSVVFRTNRVDYCCSVIGIDIIPKAFTFCGGLFPETKFMRACKRLHKVNQRPRGGCNGCHLLKEIPDS